MYSLTAAGGGVGRSGQKINDSSMVQEVDFLSEATVIKTGCTNWKNDSLQSFPFVVCLHGALL